MHSHWLPSATIDSVNCTVGSVQDQGSEYCTVGSVQDHVGSVQDQGSEYCYLRQFSFSSDWLDVSVSVTFLLHFGRSLLCQLKYKLHNRIPDVKSYRLLFKLSRF